MVPNPFITLSTQIMAAVTTPTATEEIAVMMWMALNCFFANKYLHAICSSALTASAIHQYAPFYLWFHQDGSVVQELDVTDDVADAPFHHEF